MPARRILVLGATGATGRQVMEQACSAGHEVTALVRNPDRLPASARPARVITADLLENPSILDSAVAGQDAVISALGVGQSFKPHGLIGRTAPALVAAMQRQKVQRLVFTSAFGIGATWRDTPILPRLFIRTLLRQIYADKAAGEAVILSSSLDWTIVYPAGLTNGPMTGTCRVGERLSLSGFPSVARADIAAVLLRQLDDPTSIRKGLLVAN